MKKLLLLTPFLLFSCKKEAPISEKTTKDSADNVQPIQIISEDSIAKRDSMINNSPITKEVLRTGVMREVEGNKIIRIADAEQLPFNIGEEFTKDDEEFILKIKNFAKDNLTASVKPQNSDMNIRINQIKLPNGDYDGPFGREISNYEVPQKGEIWLVIGKGNMASGVSKGRFNLSVE